MTNKAEVEVFCEDTNAWVIRTPGRHYPSLVIQGDSFSGLFAPAQEILERARIIGDPELVAVAEELREKIWVHLHHYEQVLEQHGLPLPYNRIKWPS